MVDQNRDMLWENSSSGNVVGLTEGFFWWCRTDYAALNRIDIKFPGYLLKVVDSFNISPLSTYGFLLADAVF